MKVLLIISGFFVLNGCTGYPDNIKPVEGFELNRYLGTWYEVARLDHSFERGLEQVSANYSMREDGGVKVVNRGFDTAEQQWNESTGRAYFVQNEHTGHLKVSFFGPFYGSYVVFRTGVDYQYAFVAGNNYDYLWLLSRTAEIPKQLRHEFIEVAQSKGYAVNDLIWVNQSAK
jgi:apolipoprotein D and lipocalin family protein